ncbi:MAG TPA: hypothetical protein VGY54_26500 [Polyangiaceae bacterium]|nr:hypothetical protein [Polyangiaceae bacterium]
MSAFFGELWVVRRRILFHTADGRISSSSIPLGTDTRTIEVDRVVPEAAPFLERIVIDAASRPPRVKVLRRGHVALMPIAAPGLRSAHR